MEILGILKEVMSVFLLHPSIVSDQDENESHPTWWYKYNNIMHTTTTATGATSDDDFKFHFKQSGRIVLFPK